MPLSKRKIEFLGCFGPSCFEAPAPWMMLGDLNEIIKAKEKFDGRSILRKKLYLKEFMQDVGGIDIRFSGNAFTWSNKHEGLALVKEHLDRMIANGGWNEAFPMASNCHLRCEESDHYPIMLSLNTKENKNNRSFQFFQAWISDLSCWLVINKA